MTEAAIAGETAFGLVWSMTVYCGIDWAECDHGVALVDTDGTLAPGG